MLTPTDSHNSDPPFRAPTVYETIRRVVEELPAPPRRLRGSVPRDRETICLKCLEKEPAKRYASAESLAADLSRWLKGEPIAARRVGPLERLRMWARRRPTAAALVAVSVVSLAALLGGGIYSANRIDQQNRDLQFQAGDLTAALADVQRNEQALTAKQAELVANAKQLGQTVATLLRNEYRHVGRVYPRQKPKRVVLTIDNAPWHRGH